MKIKVVPGIDLVDGISVTKFYEALKGAVYDMTFRFALMKGLDSKRHSKI